MIDYVKSIIQKIKKRKAVSSENIIGMFCMCFAGYCGVLHVENEGIRRIKYEIETKHPQVSAEYAVLEKYTRDTDVLCEFIKMLGMRNFSEHIWKEFAECLISMVLPDKIFSDVKMRSFLAKLCISLIAPGEGSFYDGVSGIGEGALSAGDYDKGDKLQIYAQEANEVYYAISVLRAYMKDYKKIRFMKGEALKEPAFLQNGMLQKFDYAMIYPPFGIPARKIENELYPDTFERFIGGVPPATPCEWLYIKHLAGSLGEGGRGIAVVPVGTLFNSAAEWMREEFIKKGIIECVISLPQNSLINSTFPLNLLILNKDKKYDKIFFIRGEHWFEEYNIGDKISPQILIDNITDCFKQKKEVDGICRHVSAEMLENFILLPSRYVEKPITNAEFGKLLIREPSGEGWTTLKKTGTMYRGINLSVSTKGSCIGNYKVINYIDIQNGELMCGNIKNYPINNGTNIERYKVRKGDLIISCKGTTIKICVVPEIEETILLSANFIGIKVDGDKFDARFLKYFLESPAGRQFLQRRQVGTSIFTLAARDLEQIPIPLISLQQQKEYISELLREEEFICKKIEGLKKELSRNKWDFYEKIGLGDVIKVIKELSGGGYEEDTD